jgi:hypothetical protein
MVSYLVERLTRVQPVEWTLTASRRMRRPRRQRELRAKKIQKMSTMAV